MSTQPEALRLADWLEADACDLQPPMDAAAELRRLHAENELLCEEREEPHKKIAMYIGECNRLESERDEALAQFDALLEALRDALELIETISPIEGHVVRAARAAIAKAEGQS